MLQTFSAKVARVDDLTHDVRVNTLELIEPAEIRFQAGQFVSFEVAKPGLPFPVTRPYSIASPPSNPGAIELLFNRVPGGPGSTFLFSLQNGDTVSFRGPPALSCCASTPIGVSYSWPLARASRRFAR